MAASEFMRIGRTIPPAASPLYIRDILNGIRGLLKGRRENERFRRELQKHFDVKHCFLISSGRAALTIILRAMHKLHPERSEVLIPAFCCYSVPSAIVNAGLKVRLCDVDPETLDFDYNHLKKILSCYYDEKNRPYNEQQLGVGRHSIQHRWTEGRRQNGLLAIVPVHLFGMPADVDRVKTLGGHVASAIVEDAAQVMGGQRGARKPGTIGDVGFFSLGRGKSLSAVEGGIIVTNNDAIGEKIGLEVANIPEYTVFAVLKLFLQALALYVFQRPSFFWFPKALPFLRIGDTIYDPDFNICCMTSFQAGLARNWKTKLGQFYESREKVSTEWFRLEKIRFLADDYSVKGRRFYFLRYPIRVRNRRIWHHLLQAGESRGLGIMLTYPGSIIEIKELEKQFQGQDYPGARKLSRQLLTLPVHPLLSKKDRVKIKSFLITAAETAHAIK